jgi:hypothetical protein
LLFASRHQSPIDRDGLSSPGCQLAERDIDIEPRQSVAAPVEPVARPPIVFWSLGETSLNGIPVDVSKQREEITLILHEKRFVSSLKEVTDSFVSEIESLCIEGQQGQHRA